LTHLRVVFVLNTFPASIGAGNFDGNKLSELVVTNPGSTVGVLLNTSALPGADLAANIFLDGTVQDLIYTVSANNRGSNAATTVVLTDTLPSNVTFVSSTPNQRTCSRTDGVVTCDFGSLPAGALAFVRIEVLTPTPPWIVTDSATVSATEFDPDVKNNSAKLSYMYRP
jgi:uncharacterized repeat protein (TIGR01451 family)